MYKILFVDDDPLILKRLATCLDWAAMQLEILPYAQDGDEAVAAMELYQPDIILTDINMPKMDGLTLARHIQAMQRQTHLIVLTVNDSFGCAQQALNLGVDHYLLKPVEADALQSLLQSIVASLDSKQRESVYLNELETKAELNDKFFKDKLLNMAVSGRQLLSEEQLCREFEFYNIAPGAVQFQIITVNLEFPHTDTENHHQLSALLLTVTACIENCLYPYIACSVFADVDYNINILLGYKNAPTPMQQNVQLLCRLVLDNLQHDLGLAGTCYVSQRHSGLVNIYQCYNEAKYLLDLHEGTYAQDCILYDAFLQSELYNTFNWDGFRNLLFKYLRAGHLAELQAYLQQTLQKAASDPKLFYLVKMDCITDGLMFMQESKLNAVDVFDPDSDPIFEMRNTHAFSACCTLIQNFFEKILSAIHTHRVPSAQRLVESCVRMIQENLSVQLLSLAWLAAKLYVNQ
ncbi:MAG: response regulator, partial [Ruthenibacterium sp.]